jgi:hypothetical protein
VEAVVAMWDPDMEWLECKGMPLVIDDGMYIGHEAVLKNVLMQLPVYFDGFNIEVNELFGTADRVDVTAWKEDPFFPGLRCSHHNQLVEI